MSQLTTATQQVLRFRLNSRVWLAPLAVTALAALAVFVATALDEENERSAIAPVAVSDTPAGVRYDGGPEEGSRGLSAAAAGVRYDGGPEEGSRGISFSRTAPQVPADIRYDGGPEEGTRGAASASTQPGVRYDGGPEEGSRGVRR